MLPAKMKVLTIIAIVICAVISSSESRAKKRLNGRIKFPLITGGTEVVPHTVPWQAFLRLRLINEHLGGCGGSLLTVKTVITAAHCCVRTNIHGTLVILGAHDKDVIENTQQRFHVSKMIVHPNYIETSMPPENDICIVFLTEEAQLNSAVKTVELPRQSQAGDDFANLEGTATGWGYINSEPVIPSSVLNTVSLPILSNSECQRKNDYLAQFMGEEAPVIYPTMMCTLAAMGENVCKGDSGGPLTVEDDRGHHILVGLTSAGAVPCEFPSAPSTFTRVTSYLDWISQTAGVEIKS